MSEQYNLTNIRALLLHGFTVEELRRFSFDNLDFRPVYHESTEDTGKAKFIDLLMEYAEQKSKIKTFLAWTKESNPDKYEEYQPYYTQITSENETKAQYPSGLNIISIGVNPASIYTPSPNLPDIQFDLFFTIENTSSAQIMGVKLAVISWVIGTQRDPVNPGLLPHIKSEEPKKFPYPYTLTASQTKKAVTVDPFDSKRTEDFGKLAIPASEIGYLWKAAAFITAEDLLPIWYQLNCKIGSENDFFKPEKRRELISFNKLVDMSPIVTWE